MLAVALFPTLLVMVQEGVNVPVFEEVKVRVNGEAVNVPRVLSSGLIGSEN